MSVRVRMEVSARVRMEVSARVRMEVSARVGVEVSARVGVEVRVRVRVGGGSTRLVEDDGLIEGDDLGEESQPKRPVDGGEVVRLEHERVAHLS